MSIITKLFFTLSNGGIAPTRGTEESAGIDLFVPDNIQPVTLAPHTDIIIDSQVSIYIPPKHFLLIAERSSTAKKGLIIGAKIIDADYQGHIHIHLINYSDRYIDIKPGDKIAQAILIPIATPQPTCVKRILWRPSTRKTGSFGSTDNDLNNNNNNNNNTNTK